MSNLEARADQLRKSFNVITYHFQAMTAARSNDDLSLLEVKVINYVGQREFCIMREISAFSQVAVSTMTGVVDKLEEKGIARRERNDADRRIVRVSLTEKGHKLYREFVEQLSTLCRHMLKALDEEEQEIYLKLTRKIERAALQSEISVSEN
jgi:DNA-binding MarR family transcriptional regulator